MKKIAKILTIIVFTVITLLVLNININPWQIPNPNGILYELVLSLKEFDLFISLLGIFVFSFYYKIYFDGTRFTKKNIFIAIFSIFLSALSVISKLFQIDIFSENSFTSFSHFFKCTVMFLGFYLIYYALIKSLFKTEITKKLFANKNQKKSQIKY